MFQQPFQNCIDEEVMYKHNETWRKDHNCTFCTCWNGEPKCITHYCDVKESQVKDNVSCVRNEKFFKHGESWTDEDKCSKCKCLNGKSALFTVKRKFKVSNSRGNQL